MLGQTSALMARFSLAASPTAPYEARRHVRRAAMSWGIRGELIETAALIASELVANAAKADGMTPEVVEPAGANTGQILLTLCFTRQALRIEVTDGSPSPPVLSQVPPDAESGRGMIIIDALASEWSYSFLPTGQGKTVYCVLPTADRPGASDIAGAVGRGDDLRAAS